MIEEFLPIARTLVGLSSLKIISFGPRPLNFLACNAPIKQLYNLGVEICLLYTSGKVIDVNEDAIVLNIGYKSDGIIPRNEYTDDQNLDLTTAVQVGDEREAKVVKVNDGEGQVALSYKRLAADKGNKRLEEAFENHEVLTAKVAQVLDGGLSVVVEGARVFIPASLVSDTY